MYLSEQSSSGCRNTEAHIEFSAVHTGATIIGVRGAGVEVGNVVQTNVGVSI